MAGWVLERCPHCGAPQMEGCACAERLVGWPLVLVWLGLLALSLGLWGVVGYLVGRWIV